MKNVSVFIVFVIGFVLDSMTITAGTTTITTITTTTSTLAATCAAVVTATFSSNTNSLDTTAQHSLVQKNSLKRLIIF